MASQSSQIRSRLWALCLCLAAAVLAACSDGSDDKLNPGPYTVVITEQRYVDESRGTPANGEIPALPSRTLDTLVFMPEGRDRFPLLIFSHGLGATPQAYASLIEEVAAAGFVVVAPAFPLTNTNTPGGVNPVDTEQQPGDVSFMIDTVIAAAAAGEPPFSRSVDINNIGTFGHSNGGITTLSVMANSCCRDPRINAAVSLSAPAAPFNNGEYDFTTSNPLAMVHGTEDVLIPYEESVRVFNVVAAAKGILTLNEVGHSDFLQPAAPGFASTSNTIIDFFRTHLQDDSEAEERLLAGEVDDTVAELLYTATGGQDVTLPLPPPITNRVAAVEPNTGLVDGQVVTVIWRNFIPGGVVNILQCSSGGTGGNDVCDFTNAFILEDNPTGEGSLPLEIIVGEVGSGRCDATTDDCVVVFNDSGLQTEEAILRIPISFAP